LGFPMPKLAHYQVTDLKTRKVVKEIVDGQQRSVAILDFYQGKFRLSRTIETEELKNKSYTTLGPAYQQRFLDYPLSIDLFVGATLEQIREIFRRINSYTVPLNPEEKRHAVFQGTFKWFVHRLARRFDESFSRIGLFGEKQLVRMQDTKLIAEIVHALQNGIQTTKARELFELYKQFDKTFPDAARTDKQVTAAFDQLISWDDLHHAALMKPHQVYALGLAIIHMRTPIASLTPYYTSPALKSFDDEVVMPRLTALADVLSKDLDDVPKRFRKFAAASSEQTNVGEGRQTRFINYCRALDTTV
jgi:hypothetical protein